MLRGLLFARNRITHEVDEIGYVIAKANRPDDFSADWTWQSLHHDQANDRHSCTATTRRRSQDTTSSRPCSVTVFLGAARNRMWQHYREEHLNER